ncbi:MAG: hypothetical protein JO134_10635 [Xanthobacteraceae bacterium]|nr:hypothetical protein [Xanthobacteraceae bacterium]
MSSPFDNVPRSDERHGTTDQEIAPAAEIRAYLARHGGPSEPAPAVTPEPTSATTSEILSSVRAQPEPIVGEPPPGVLEPATFVVEDTATELPVVDATAASTPVAVEPAEPAPPESANTKASEPEQAIAEPEPVTPAPDPIAAEPEPIAVEPQVAAAVSAAPEQPVSDSAPTATIAPPQSSALPPSANSNNIDVVPERLTTAATAREAPAQSRGQQMRPRSNIPLYLLALTTVLALGAVAYQTYLLRQSLSIIDRASQRMDRVQQQNEYVRACRDLSDAYFLVKQRVAPLMAVPDRSNIAGAARISEINRLEAQEAVARFAALGAFLSNAQDAAARERYGELARVLTRLAEDAKGMQLTEFDKAFEPADKLFAQVNSDCARVSQFPKT